eukprot:scaffold22312_cov22-Prasinocladus_malaysianus.AAC.1
MNSEAFFKTFLRFLSHLSPQMRERDGEVLSTNSKLFEFLSMEDEERVVEIDGEQKTVKISKAKGSVVPRAETSPQPSAISDMTPLEGKYRSARVADKGP